MKINRNPAIAFQQGKTSGKAEGVQDGVFSALYLILLGMYNANSELEYMTDEQFKEFFKKSEEEVSRIFKDEYANDPQDLSARAVYHTNDIRKKLGLDEI